MNCNSQITNIPPCLLQQSNALKSNTYNYGEVTPNYGPQMAHPPCFGQPMAWSIEDGPLGLNGNGAQVYSDYQISDNFRYNQCSTVRNYENVPENFCGNVYKDQCPVPRVVRPSGVLSRLNLPCQSNTNWDYNQCYSYYANGCYNTCQFVNVGDMEDFM